ncbi:hypothetical protein DER44DRAFT_800892 [Fusarium oxysporum]|nr:hypothetical protein DER44DRAFT_800892 [Fusarium oxysporum]
MDISDIPSSQETVEDPTLPGSPAEGATILMTPENAEARFTFSSVADWLQNQTENPIIQAAQQHAQKFMWISSKQKKDPEVTRPQATHRNSVIFLPLLVSTRPYITDQNS